jgi:hypothetical protein
VIPVGHGQFLELLAIADQWSFEWTPPLKSWSATGLTGSRTPSGSFRRHIVVVLLFAGFFALPAETKLART